MTRFILTSTFLVFLAVGSEARAESANEIIDSVQVAMENNLPDDFTCRIDCPLLQQLLDRRLPSKMKRSSIRLYWKAPAKIRFVLETPGLSIPAQLMANIFLEQRLSAVMARFGLRAEKGKGKTFISVWLDKLKTASSEISFDNARPQPSVSTKGLDKKQVLVVTFSGLREPFAIGGVITKVKLWIDKGSYVFYQVRIFTSRTGILTLKIAYQRVSRSANPSQASLMLPSRLTLVPSLTEDGPTAAYPISAELTEYQVNTRLPDSLFE